MAYMSNVTNSPLSTIEASPGAGARIVRHTHAQDNGVWQNNGSEGQCVGADGCNKDDGVFWMRKRAASGEVVSSRSGWGSNANSVCEQGGEMLVVSEEFDLRHG